MTVMEWSALIAAITFVILAAGLLIGVRTALNRLSRLQLQAETMQEEIRQTSGKMGAFADTAQQTVNTAHLQLQQANRLFEAVGQIGDTIGHTTTAIHRVSSVISQSAVKHAESAAAERQASSMLEWMELGMAFWQQWQTNRKRYEPSNNGQGE
ncbi:DUF948 domain-containing protein [Paenibacillus glycanilyticus]|uniref:DUF948 domain-containing protein n=1 Tax=Paenibacillus glycanilyticus TaxID=126569 RepID=A0ABQ6NKV0_9BACL|nr:DUF948 domain-containing protein [Paenibacillus glycanilyticus]GMK45695.1 hypothetical protein PghCCS26_28230 [Paenibacillus glycanilyticus]